ncbi:sialate O-acetylesterase [Spirosoma koreense]
MNKLFYQGRYSLREYHTRGYVWALPKLAGIAVLVVAFLITQVSLAQIKLTIPVSRQIVQRDNRNQATVQVAGSFGQPLDAVEARVIARANGQGVNTDWVTIQANPTNGQFNGTMVVKGGWYTVQVRGRSGGNVVATDEVDRFGVGEVFAIIGHSNAQGSGCYVNGQDGCPTLPGASDDRVNVIAEDQNSSSFQQYLTNSDSQNTADSKYLPGLTFSQLTLTSGMAPFAKMPWLWGPMGDALVARINVPVLLYNAGFGGTNMQQTYWAAYNIPFQHSFVRYDLRQPYANLRNLMNLYVPTTGIRAVLVQHGENDRENPTDSTLKYYRKVIDKTRLEFNKPNLAFIISISSFYLYPNQNVRSAQFQTINPAYNAFQGPDLDNISSTADRPDGAHYSQSGQTKAGQMWANSIVDSYLTNDISPYPAEPQPLTNLSCASNNQLTLMQPSGYQSIWNTNSTANSLTVGSGTYSARIMNPQHKVLFTAPVVVPSVVQPSTPTITTLNNTKVICKSTGLALTSSYSGPNVWSTGGTAASIMATTPGVYSVQAKNPVYGCLSGPVSNTIGLATTALKLDLLSSRKVVAMNDTVSYQLKVTNNSGCDAGEITLENRLPLNMRYVSTGSSSLTLINADAYGNYKMISGLFNSIPAGQSVSAKYVARLTAAGTYINAAEIITTTNDEEGASPGNGTNNGEIDESRTTVQTSTGSQTVYVSPNPNQQGNTQPTQPMPGANEADLSLSLQSVDRVVTVGQIVSFTITVANRGKLTATNVSVVDLLPVGLRFVSSPSGINANESRLSIGLSAIPAGTAMSVEFKAQVTSQGTLTNSAQITASDQYDSDSTPNNGFANGEDDQATIDLRTP